MEQSTLVKSQIHLLTEKAIKWPACECNAAQGVKVGGEMHNPINIKVSWQTTNKRCFR